VEWRISLPSGRALATGAGPGVMAVLNVTPDSFSDGARFASAEEAAAEGARYADLGAAIVDIGGESTRPKGKAYGEGAGEISSKEEASRVLPVLSRLRALRPALPVSIDTRRGEVARAALDAGADVVNIVTGLNASDEMSSTIATARAAVILNHCRGTPQTTFEDSCFTDVVAEVATDLEQARSRAISAGIPPERILLDPGLGFGKDTDQNFELLARLSDLAPPGVPLVVGASRKAFLGSLFGGPPADRLPESLAAVAVAARAAPPPPPPHRGSHLDETVRFLATLSRAAPKAALSPPRPA
jgi:dihydropteroate synthase